MEISLELKKLEVKHVFFKFPSLSWEFAHPSLTIQRGICYIEFANYICIWHINFDSEIFHEE